MLYFYISPITDEVLGDPNNRWSSSLAVIKGYEVRGVHAHTKFSGESWFIFHKCETLPEAERVLEDIIRRLDGRPVAKAKAKPAKGKAKAKPAKGKAKPVTKKSDKKPKANKKVQNLIDL